MLKLQVDLKTHAAVLKHPAIAGVSKWSKPDAEFSRWLTKNAIPSQIAQLLRIGLPQKGANHDFWQLFSPKMIMRETKTDKALLPARLLPVGSSLCGDPIVIDVAGPLVGAVAFISHEQYWGSEVPQPREWLRYVSCDWTAFLIGVAKDAIPIDSFQTWSETNTQALWEYIDHEAAEPE